MKFGLNLDVAEESMPTNIWQCEEMVNQTPNMNAVCAATCVMVVTSGVSGQKLLFMYPYNHTNKTTESTASELPSSSYYSQGHHSRMRVKPTLTKIIENSTSESIMTEFTLTTYILGQMLAVHKDNCNKPFELKIDNHRFVAWPKEWKAKDCDSRYHISIVFAIRTSSEIHSVEAYQRLSKKLAICFVELQDCEGYLEDEERIMVEYEHDTSEPFKKTLEKSRMARTLMEVFDEVRKTGSCHKYINDFVEIGFCDEAFSLAKSNVMSKGKKEIEGIIKSIRPYHGILLLEDFWPTPDANPSVALLLKHCSPDRSILDMSTASGIPIFEVFLIVRHLLNWTRAILIYPLCNTNVYTSATSPQPLEKMIEKFAEQFGANIHLAAGLAHFNPPATLVSFIRPNLPLSEQQVRAKLVVALLRHQMLMQLHQFCYIIKPYSNAILPRAGRHCPEVLKKKISESCIDPKVRLIVADICGQMLETESFAQVDEKLTIFISMAPLMDGNHHMEDIKYQRNLKRTVIEDVLDAFKLVIAKFLRPDFVAE